MKKYRVEFEYNGKRDFAVVEASDMSDAQEIFLTDYAVIGPNVIGISLYTVCDEIQKERTRQVTKEGYSYSHDDKFINGELAAAAATYAFPGMLEKLIWPFSNPPKIKDTRSNLIRAAAFIVAEIERLDRKELKEEWIKESQNNG